MPKLRKHYSAEEKVRIVLASLSGQWTQSQISSKYGVHATQISHWKREFKSRVADIFRNKRGKEDLEKDALIETLYKEIGRQKVELDWLKKKSEWLD